MPLNASSRCHHNIRLVLPQTHKTCLGTGSLVAPRGMWVHTCRSCATHKHQRHTINTHTLVYFVWRSARWVPVAVQVCDWIVNWCVPELIHYSLIIIPNPPPPPSFFSFLLHLLLSSVLIDNFSFYTVLYSCWATNWEPWLSLLFLITSSWSNTYFWFHVPHVGLQKLPFSFLILSLFAFKWFHTGRPKRHRD